MKKWLFCLCLIRVGEVQAAIYKHTDFNGRVTYSNRPLKGAVRITTDPEEKKRQVLALEQVRQEKLSALQRKSIPRHGTATSLPSQIKNSPIPSSMAKETFPFIVDQQKQKARDTQRERILMAELKGEIALRAENQKALENERAIAPLNLTKIKRLEEDLHVHDNNIAALQKEINRIK